MIRLSVFADEIDPMLECQLAAVREKGLTLIEMRGVDGRNIADFAPDELIAVRAKLDAAGVGVSQIGSPVGKAELDAPLSETLSQLARVMDNARVVGADKIRVFSFFHAKARPDEVFRRVEAMTDAARRAGMTLLHENEKGIFGDDAAGCAALMERFAGPHFGAVFDFANFVQVGQDPLAAYERLAPYVRYVHVKDALSSDGSVVPAGYGDGRIKEILARLLPKGYDGVLSLEPHLAEFRGMAALEQGDATLPSQRMDGAAAFDMALTALLGILKEIQD